MSLNTFVGMAENMNVSILQFFVNKIHNFSHISKNFHELQRHNIPNLNHLKDSFDHLNYKFALELMVSKL